jgi:DNA-binding MarR family transcriptional regulator
VDLNIEKNAVASKVSDLRKEVNCYIVERLSLLGIENISVSHGNILFTLFKYESLTMKELSVKINRDASTVTTLVKKLQKNGYVVIEENANDTRSKVVSLSDKTLSLKEEFFRISMNLNDNIWQDISEEESEVFMNCIDKMIGNLKNK